MSKYLSFAFSVLACVLQQTSSQPQSGSTPQGGSAPQAGSTPQAGTQNQQTGETRTPPRAGDPRNAGIRSYNSPTERAWFSSPGVRQQLGLNDEQYNRLNDSYGTSWRRYNESVRRLGQDLAREQRRERLRAMRENFNREFSTARDQVFTEPERRSRYDQLYYQYRGYGAFDDPMVQQRLRLSPDQRRQLREYNREWSRQMSELNDRYVADPDAARVSYRDLQTQARERLGTVLTPEQRQRWLELTGEPYDFEADAYFYERERNLLRTPGSLAPQNNLR